VEIILHNIGNYAFANTALEAVVIPKGITEIGEYVFSYCGSLASVTIPDSVKYIGQEAFNDCKSLTTVTISPVKRNFNDSFRNCPRLGLASQAALRAAGVYGRVLRRGSMRNGNTVRP
jgi:hypothetical protein